VAPTVLENTCIPDIYWVFSVFTSITITLCVSFYILYILPIKLISSAQTGNRHIPFNLNLSWHAWTFLIVYSKAKYKSNDNTALCLSDLLNESDECPPIWTYSTEEWISLSMSIISSESPQLQILFQILTWYSLLTFTSFKLLRLFLSITNFCVAHLVTDNLSLILGPQHSDPYNYKFLQETVNQVYLNAISLLSRCNQSDCESSHKMSKSIYEYFNVGNTMLF